jgi:hypothetical protein
MKRIIQITLITAISAITFSGCNTGNQEQKTKRAVERQQTQYNIAQPLPAYDWSLERELVIKLYNLRNEKVSTHTVWRSNTGVIEGDCTSIGYGIPYDTSLTNPLKATGYRDSQTSIGQAEPNGVFASTNTSATWVMCVEKSGSLAPIYIESKVTTYPYSLRVDYNKNRVFKDGDINFDFKTQKPDIINTTLDTEDKE